MPTKGWHKHYESVSKVESEVKYWMAVTKCEGDHFSLEYYVGVELNSAILHTLNYKKTERPQNTTTHTYQWMKCGYL